MAEDKEAFLSRWSRRKLDAREPPAPGAETPKPPLAPAAPSAASEARALPPLEEVGPDTDFSVFMGKEVEEGLRRAALKKLFADPRFNIMDGLDTYTEDYTLAETISPEMLATLEHAKHTLFGPRPEEKETAQDSGAARQARDEASPQSAAAGETKRDPEGEDGTAG
jgi:hypothetical protein